jgi:purine-nucleoside phosphorylase
MPGDNKNSAQKIFLPLAPFRPSIALILGSGLGDFADHMDVEKIVEASSIPGYPVGSVHGHEGKLIFGAVRENGKSSPPLLIFKGRVHYYETGNIEKVLFPISLAKDLGAKTLLVTNAAGGVNTDFAPGQLMLIHDYLNLTGLEISRVSSTQKRQSLKLDERLQKVFRSAALDLGIPLEEGTYCWLQGPAYETSAEINMARRLGADAVGMSTVPEIIRARDLGMRVAGISLISNLATGLSPSKLSHQEVTETANRVKARFVSLMRRVLVSIDR